MDTALGDISVATTMKEVEAAMPPLDLLLERMNENNDNEDDNKDTNNAKGTQCIDVDGKDAMPLVQIK